MTNRSVFSTGLFGEKVCKPRAKPRANSAKRLLASFPGQDREPAEQTEQANCATLEQLMTFEAGISPPTAQRAAGPFSPAIPGPQGESAFCPGMAQPLHNGFPASVPIQGKEGGSPACQSGLQPAPSAAGRPENIG